MPNPSFQFQIGLLVSPMLYLWTCSVQSYFGVIWRHQCNICGYLWPRFGQYHFGVIQCISLKVGMMGYLLNVFSCPTYLLSVSRSWPLVLCNPGREIPSIEIYPDTTTTIQRGASALFQCRVTGGTPSPTVEWTRYYSLTLNTFEMIEQIMLQYILLHVRLPQNCLLLFSNSMCCVVV